MPEEKQYQELVLRYKFIQKAEFGRMSKNMISVARKQTQIEIEQIRSKNAMIRERRQFLTKQEKWDKNSAVTNTLFSNIRVRMKNKQATIVQKNSKKKTNLSLISEDNESEENDSQSNESEYDEEDDQSDSDEEQKEEGNGDQSNLLGNDNDDEQEQLVEIDEKKIFEQHLRRIRKSQTMNDFEPSTEYFNLGDEKL